MSHNKKSYRSDTIISKVPDISYFFSIIPLIYLVGIFLPENLCWGFNYWRYLPNPFSVIILLLSFIVFLPSINIPISLLIKNILSSLKKYSINFNRFYYRAIIFIILIVILYNFRTQAHIYGDGFTRLDGCDSTDNPQLYGKLYLEIASILLHHYSIIIGAYLNISAVNSFALINCVGGAIGIHALFSIAGLISENKATRWIIFLGSLSSGAIILFFGYIENYTWATTVSLWSLYWSIKYAQNKSPFWPSAILALVAMFFHLIAFPFLVLSFLSIFIKKMNNKKIKSDHFVRNISIFSILASMGFTLLLQLFNLPQVFVPLWPYEDFPYWFLSFEHVGDFINIMMNLSLVGIVIFIYLFVSGQIKNIISKPEDAILILAAVFTILATFWIDPEIGAIRDWDLLSLSGFPLTLLALHKLSSTSINVKKGIACHFTLFIIFLITIIPNLMEKRDIDQALKRIDNKLWMDVHYQKNYKNAERCLPWGVILKHTLSRNDLSKKYFRRRAETVESSYMAWLNLGEIYENEKNLDSTCYYYKKVDLYFPDDPDVLIKLAMAEYYMQKKEDAIIHSQRALSLAPNDFLIQRKGAIIISICNHKEEAIIYFRKAYQLSNQQEDIINLGIIHSQLQTNDSACFYLTKGLSGNSVTKDNVGAYKALFYSLTATGKYLEAQQILELLTSSGFILPEIEQMKKRLNH